MKFYEIFIRSWFKISVDFFQLDGSNYFVMVDYYSDFFELDFFSGNILVNIVIRVMKR